MVEDVCSIQEVLRLERGKGLIKQERRAWRRNKSEQERKTKRGRDREKQEP